MNCPECGAENDTGARFCAECGAPLEEHDIEATLAGQRFDMSANDMTIMSMPDQLAAEQAKTVAVDQAKLAGVLAEVDESPVFPPPVEEPEPVMPVASVLDDSPSTAGESAYKPDTPAKPLPAAPPPPPVKGSSTSAGAGGSNKKLWIIIGVIVLVLLCCCCCSLAFGGVLGSDPELWEDMINELSQMPVFLAVV